MDGLARQRIGIAAETAEVRKQQGFVGEWNESRMAAASSASARMYEVSRQFEDEELRLLKSRRAEQENSQREAIGTLVIALAVVLLLLAPAYAGVHYHARQRARTERRLADIVAAVPVAVWQLKTQSDGARKFEYVSPSASLRGVDAAAFLDRPAGLLDFVIPEDRTAFLAAMQQSQRELRSLDVTTRVEIRSGDVRWIRSCASVRREDDGAVLWNGYWLDITPQKQLERQLTDANNALESFSYSVSHDLRAPLATIAGFARALAERASATLDERSTHFLNRIRAGVEQMEDLIEGMLVLCQVSRAPVQRERVDITALATEILSELRGSEPDRAAVTEVAVGLEAKGDVRLLRQVLANLLGNAWKFSRPKPVTQIYVGAHHMPDGAPAIVVRDNGVGFANPVGKDLFEAFQRLHSTAEFPGSGIGLATVKQIIERHGGHVWADSVIGEGTAVYFTLPATS